MAEIITTLHKKGDSTIDVYPNIKASNIPNNAITASKINSGAVTNPKIADSSIGESKIIDGSVTASKIYTGAVTTAKLSNNAVTTDKLDDASVTTSKINDGAVTSDKLGVNSVTTSKIQNESVDYSKLGNNIQKLILQLQYTYNLYIGDSDNNVYFMIGTSTISNELNEYLASDISHALNFDKNSADYTTTDFEILTIILNGISKHGWKQSGYTNLDLYVDGKHFYINKSATDYVIGYMDGGTIKFSLHYNPQTNTLTSLNNTKYVYLDLIKTINENITMEL